MQPTLKFVEKKKHFNIEIAKKLIDWVQENLSKVEKF